MHDQRIIHGDLRGVCLRIKMSYSPFTDPQANIMIDGDGHTRLTGLDVVTIASDRSVMSSPPRPGGAFAWMSPELLHPERFGLKKPHPTTESDCYALGMVIYEVLSGRAPFSNRSGPEVVLLVLQGERPEKLQGNETNLFTDKIWEILELCWRDRPSDRPSARGVLIGLGENLSPSEQPSDADGDTKTDISDDTENGPGMFSHPATTLSLTIPKPRQDRHLLALTRSAETHNKLLILGLDGFVS